MDHLYESVAETLVQPDEVARPKKRKLVVADDPVMPQDPYLEAGVASEPPTVDEPTVTEQRHMPPGTMYDDWKQF